MFIATRLFLFESDGKISRLWSLLKPTIQLFLFANMLCFDSSNLVRYEVVVRKNDHIFYINIILGSR